MKRMLINATQPEELRVAIVDGQRLDDLDIDHSTKEQKKSNIYKGTITRIEPSLEAAFVDYGSERHGFLPFKEISRAYLSNDSSDGGRPDVRNGIKEGQEIVIQIEKEERGNKGAALTTFVSLAGRYLVLMPNNPRAGGVSRRIGGDERSELRDAMSELNLPNGMGMIIRTAGVGRSVEELQWDLDYQVQIWEAIQNAAGREQAPCLLYQESNVIVRALRDYFRSDIGEILIDDASVYNHAKQFIERCMPHNLRKLKLYEEEIPLFSRYQIETQIESAFQREVRLPSGGAIVIDHTEALISIDINSARATKGSDIEETATNTNLEAADEIARQLRIRDNGGLVVIDFIDMLSKKNQRAVEERLKEALKMDRARVQVGRISRFGLLEMSRQRLRPSLGEASQYACPRCSGQGTIRSIESLALAILRLIEEEAMKDNTGRIIAQMPVDVATFLLNEKRDNVTDIEKANKVHILLVPNPALETPHYNIERLRTVDIEEETSSTASYDLATPAEAPYVPNEGSAAPKPLEKAVVQNVSPDTPAPARQPLQPVQNIAGGFISRIFNALFGSDEEEEKPPAKNNNNNQRRNNRNNQNRRRRGANRDNNQRRRQQQDNNQSGDTEQQPKNRRNKAQSKAQDNDKQKQDNNKPQQEKRNERQQDSSNESPNRRRRNNRRRKSNTSEQDNDNVKAVTTQETETATEAKPATNEAATNKEKKPNQANKQSRGRSSKPAQKNDAATNNANEATTASNKASGSDNKVSAVQPSQLKSSVRSLAEQRKDKPEKAEKAPAHATQGSEAVAPANQEAAKSDTAKATQPQSDNAPQKVNTAATSEKTGETPNDAAEAASSEPPKKRAPRSKKSAKPTTRNTKEAATDTTSEEPKKDVDSTKVDRTETRTEEAKPAEKGESKAAPTSANKAESAPAVKTDNAADSTATAETAEQPVKPKPARKRKPRAASNAQKSLKQVETKPQAAQPAAPTPEEVTAVKPKAKRPVADAPRKEAAAPKKYQQVETDPKKVASTPTVESTAAPEEKAASRSKPKKPAKKTTAKPAKMIQIETKSAPKVEEATTTTASKEDVKKEGAKDTAPAVTKAAEDKPSVKATAATDKKDASEPTS